MRDGRFDTRLTEPGRLTTAGPRLRELASAAEGRGLLRYAACLRKYAAINGDAMAAAELIMELRGVFPGVRNPPWFLADRVGLDDPWAVANLMDELRRIGADEQLAVLIGRGPADHASCGDLAGTVSLLGELRRAGAAQQVGVLAGRLAASAGLDDPAQVIRLISGLRGAGAYPQIAALLARDPVAGVALDDPDTVVALILELRLAGADDQALALADRAAACFADRDPGSASRAADALRVNLADENEAFAFRFVHGSYEPAVAASVLTMLANSGEEQKIRLFLASDPAGTVPLRDAAGVARLLGALRALNETDQLRVLLARDPAGSVAPGDFAGAVRMLDALRRLGMDGDSKGGAGGDFKEGVGGDFKKQARDLAGQATAEDPRSLALLLTMLAEDGARDEIAALLARCPAARTGMDDESAVAALLTTLRAIGEESRAAALVGRLPDEGHFGLFLDQGDNRTRYRFGREPDGTPAGPWGWDDLI